MVGEVNGSFDRADEKTFCDRQVRMGRSKGMDARRMPSRWVRGQFDFDGMQASVHLQQEVDFGSAGRSPVMECRFHGHRTRLFEDVADDAGLEQGAKEGMPGQCAR